MHYKKYYKILSLALLCMLFTNCKDNSKTSKDVQNSASSAFEKENPDHHHPHTNGHADHTHDPHDDEDHHHNTTHTSHNDNSQVPQVRYMEDENGEAIAWDMESIYKTGDLFKTISGLDTTKKPITFPSSKTVKKLIAFIDFVPEHLDEYTSNQEHITALKSLDSFARKHPNYHVDVVHFDLISKGAQRQLFLDKIKSKRVHNVTIPATSYYDSLQINVGPMYVKLDEQNHIEGILFGARSSSELD